MAMEQKRTEDWYRLDLSAIVYPTLQRRDFSSVYRLSVVLKEEIDPAVLQQAVDQVMPRFPTYKAAIRKGVFWRYLEPNNRPGPFVQPDVKNPRHPVKEKGQVNGLPAVNHQWDHHNPHQKAGTDDGQRPSCSGKHQQVQQAAGHRRSPQNTGGKYPQILAANGFHRPFFLREGRWLFLP